MKTWPFGAKYWAILIFGFLAAIQVQRGACLARHCNIPGSSTLLYYVVFFCLISYWLDLDSRETQTLRVWDMGFFLYLAWPVIVPYYLAKTRGPKRALLIILGFIGVFVGAYLPGAAIFVFRMSH